MEIKVLGTGCAKCNKLMKTVKEIVESEKIDAEVVKVENMKDIIGYGVMATPALVIDEKVQFSGSVPSKKKLIKMLAQ